MDSTICLTTFELIAFSQGIGTCWAGFFQMAASSWPPLQEALHLPEGHVLTAAMMAGYPRLRYQLLPQRQETQITWRP
jgi:nitroreductase